MGESWDEPAANIAFRPDIWELCFDLLPPGGHLIAFGATRMRMTCWPPLFRGAGFEIRDMLGWVQAQGFPKSLDVAKAIDKRLGAKREAIGRQSCHRRDGGWDIRQLQSR